MKRLLLLAMVAIPLPENTTNQITLSTNGVLIASYPNVTDYFVFTPLLKTTYTLTLNTTNLLFYQQTVELPEVLDEMAWFTNSLGNPDWSFLPHIPSRDLRTPKGGTPPAAPTNLHIGE